MKTKIYLLMLVFTSLAISANAQFKVYSSNTVSVGSLSAPPSGYEMQVTGNSLFNNNVDVSGVINGRNYSIPSPGASPGWVKVGTFTASQSGQTIRIVAYIHNGYNASNTQDATYYINFKTSNGSSVDGNGFAGNGSWYSNGFDNSIQPGYIKWKANAAGGSATSFDLYMDVPAYADNSHYTVSLNNGASWINVGLSGQSDPGAGSSTVLIPITQFDIPYGNVGIGTSSPNEQLQITGNLSLPATTATTGIYKSGANTFIHSYGTNNFFAGVNAGNLTLTGSCNVGVGSQALTSMTLAGTDNVGVGYQSLYSLTKGSFNIGIGYQALFSDIGISPGQAGNNNVGIGLQALYSNVSGYDNVAVGNYALTLNTGNYNTALGHNAGASFAANTNNTFIGYGANAGANNLSNATASNAGRWLQGINKIRL
jgi:hypothetical protein